VLFAFMLELELFFLPLHYAGTTLAMYHHIR
jgi:hypothetical protein